MRRRRPIAAAVALLALSLGGASRPVQAQRDDRIPDRLSDRDFWALSQSLSEPDGPFHSDNLVSNEVGLQKVLPALADRHPAGGVYLGVGPEQNFTYIAALKPRIAFIVDVRAANRGVHLLYKALFELAGDRAEFLSLLFSRARPEGLTRDASAADLFRAFASGSSSEQEYASNAGRVIDLLRRTHGFDLPVATADGLEHAYRNFARTGPATSYTSSRQPMFSGAVPPAGLGQTYAEIMQVTDANDRPASFLSSEDRFQTVKNLETRNLIVPVVGNFSGPIAMRKLGDWLRARQAVVSVFYLSNVEDYLQKDNTWTAFCRNAATLPVDDASEFVRTGLVNAANHGVQTPIHIAWSADRSTVTMSYQDGSSRQMTGAAADDLIRSQFRALTATTASIADETKTCRQP